MFFIKTDCYDLDLNSNVPIKQETVKELIDDGGEEDDKNNSSHADPNNKQNTKLFRYANTTRFAYNWALGKKRKL